MPQQLADLHCRTLPRHRVVERACGGPRGLLSDGADDPLRPAIEVDAGAVAWVHQQLLDACARGAALLLISEDLDEILALADRIAVIHAGRLTPARPARSWTLAELGLAMAGEGARDAA